MFMNTPLSPVSGRLASLDILRGFDLFLLVFFQPVFVALGQRLNFPWLNDILYQFDHESWIGFRFWDLVMPLFLFMTGASMPFSFSKFKNAPNKWPVYRKIIKRFVLLFIFGMIVQGNLLGLNPDSLYLYSNTLQAIATGYLIAAIILLHCSFRYQVLITLLLLGIVLIGVSLLWSLQMPIIKRLWTCSMTLFSGGLCFLLMGLFYYWIDYKEHTYGLDWLKIYGMNSITAYILGEVVNFRCIAASISYGLEQFLGNYYSVWLSFANYLIVFFILQMMYKHRIFLKI